MHDANTALIGRYNEDLQSFDPTLQAFDFDEYVDLSALESENGSSLQDIHHQMEGLSHLQSVDRIAPAFHGLEDFLGNCNADVEMEQHYPWDDYLADNHTPLICNETHASHSGYMEPSHAEGEHQSGRFDAELATAGLAQLMPESSISSAPNQRRSQRE